MPVTRGPKTKRVCLAIGVMLLALTAPLSSGPLAAPAAATADPARGSDGGHNFERFLRRYEAANTAFVNGDPSPWLEIVAERDPASIFGGFGGLGEAGVDDVHQRYMLAAGAFLYSGAEVEFEYLVTDVRGRLAYTVAIERAMVLYAGHTEVEPQVLRVTMIFRHDNGAWRIVHRHADMMIELELPTP